MSSSTKDDIFVSTMANKVSHKLFHSKLLLFGEHIINKGARGLAIPLEGYDGILKFGALRDKHVKESNESLEQLANYIIHHEQIAEQYDTNQILEDVEKGLYFDSNIPQGYGLGSSGALVAAVYHQYNKHKKKSKPTSTVKHELALLESHYHGKSSGLDAIVCYLNKAVIVDNGEVSETFDLPTNTEGAMKVFTINTHKARSTSPFVNAFLDKCKDKKFMTTVQQSLVPANDIAIDSFLNRNYSELWKSTKIISQLQMDMIPEFIPKPFHEVWKTGLRTDQFHLKICGAGGGGFIIGFTKNEAEWPSALGGLDVKELIKF